MEYLRIYDNSNHTAVAWVLLAVNHEELDSIVRILKREGKYFEKEHRNEDIGLVEEAAD